LRVAKGKAGESRSNWWQRKTEPETCLWHINK